MKRRRDLLPEYPTKKYKPVPHTFHALVNRTCRYCINKLLDVNLTRQDVVIQPGRCMICGNERIVTSLRVLGKIKMRGR